MTEIAGIHQNARYHQDVYCGKWKPKGCFWPRTQRGRKWIRDVYRG